MIIYKQIDYWKKIYFIKVLNINYKILINLLKINYYYKNIQ